MNTQYTAIIGKEGNWRIGWIEEVPGVNCQEANREELIETLRITLKEALEFNRMEAISAISKLPESADIDDILYRLYVIDKIIKGRKAIQDGKIISVELLKKKLKLW